MGGLAQFLSLGDHHRHLPGFAACVHLPQNPECEVQSVVLVYPGLKPAVHFSLLIYEGCNILETCFLSTEELNSQN